jgi:hypothetical protein
LCTSKIVQVNNSKGIKPLISKLIRLKTKFN